MEREFVGIERFMQVDFSENYTCMYQDDIQSAHWKQDQVSLFTAAISFNGKQHSKVIASDNLDHGKDAVVAYVDYLLDTLPASVKTVSVWSDGPSSQFKNDFKTNIKSALDGITLLHPMEKDQLTESVVQ